MGALEPTALFTRVFHIHINWLDTFMGTAPPFAPISESTKGSRRAVQPHQTLLRVPNCPWGTTQARDTLNPRLVGQLAGAVVTWA